MGHHLNPLRDGGGSLRMLVEGDCSVCMQGLAVLPFATFECQSLDCVQKHGWNVRYVSTKERRVAKKLTSEEV